MANYTRIEGHNSSNCCLMMTILGFVLTCLVGGWMTMSSSNASIRMGISYEQFIGGIPKVGGSMTDSSYDLKRNSSQGGEQGDNNHNMQRNESALPKQNQSPYSEEAQKFEPKEEEEHGIEKDMNAQKTAEEQQLNDGEFAEDASYQNATQEGSEYGLQQKNGTNGNSGSQGSDEAVKEASERETKVEGSERSGKNQSLNGSNDRPKISNETSALSMTPPTQSADAEKQKDLQPLQSSELQAPKRWTTCNVSTGPDYIPCLDNIKAVKKLRSRSHFEHRERHCPDKAPSCLVRLPQGYRIPIKWPKSRDMIWFANAPHTRLVEYKRPQNWVKVYGKYLTFPGGGTQFKHGALHYIDFIQQTVPDISWGKRSRVILDVGCGVASFGGYLFDRDVLTMSMAPKDEHEAQVQFALERGIPAISAVMGSQRLPFPALVYDVIHCARCRVPWHNEGGRLLLELDRLLRPGGYFVWSATPVYRKNTADVTIWKAMSELTQSICWELVKIGSDKVNGVSAAIYRKPTSNDCYEGRQENNPPLCDDSDDPNAAWYTPLTPCIHKVPTDPSERGAQWPPHWPSRLEKPPYWLKGSNIGVPDKLVSKNFIDDYDHWKQVVANSYSDGLGVDWSSVRNVMDMRASYGGFAAALKDKDVWVMNVIPVNSSDTLPVIYERGLFGVYHDWCESFNTYPRSYDLLHADHLFSDLKKRCDSVAVMAEIDRILRPEAWLIVRDDPETISMVEGLAKSLQWRIKLSYSADNEGLICVQKTRWRPSEVETIISAIE